jgi:anti-sigma factor RsiW
MTGSACEGIKDLLADVVAGGLSQEEDGPVRDHLLTCGDCRAELEILQELRAGMAQEFVVPPGLEGRIQASLRNELGEVLAEGVRSNVIPLGAGTRRRKVPTWALSAAAVVVLALGTGIIRNRVGPGGVTDPLAVASQEPLPEAWLWDDGMVAGAPVFDGLSDEDLEALLEEFEG